jgi:23S rRNA-/tRNA-specific pseudouridylate synthase
MPNPAAAPISQAEIEARVLYRDAMILVIDKPTGIPVHAGFGGGPNLEQAFTHLAFGLPRAPSPKPAWTGMPVGLSMTRIIASR